MTLTEVLTPELLADADRHRLGIVSSSLLMTAGIRKSRQKGASLDFSDFRAYIPGDDARKIDWRGFAKSGKTNIKLYDEQKQSNVNFVVDFSRSMDYGDGIENKLFYSALCACLLAYCHIKGGDRVSLYFMGEELKAAGAPITSLASFSGLVKAADEELKKEKTAELRYNLAGLEKGGLCFVFSDFYSECEYRRIIRQLTERGQRAVLIHILTRREIRPGFKGSYTFTDLENGNKRDIFSKEATDDEYEKLVNMHKNEIKKYSSKRNVIYFDFSTDINILSCVFKIFGAENRI